jgi:hypothetical protein
MEKTDETVMVAPSSHSALVAFGERSGRSVAAQQRNDNPRGFVKTSGRRFAGRNRGREVMTGRIPDLNWRRFAAGTLLLAISGCTFSTTRYGWPGSYAPAGVPNAQNCVPISFGQPTEFACPGGKVYTAQQLKSLREKKAASGTVASAGY